MNQSARVIYPFVALLLAASAVPVVGQIYVAPFAQTPDDLKRVRVSVKVMNRPDGQRPTIGYYHSDEQIQAAISDSNLALENMGADWRLDLIEVLDVRGLPEWSGALDCEDKSIFENRAKSDPTRYLFRNTAINIYVFEALTGCGGYCSLPSSGEDIIIVNNRDGILNWGLGWLHEIGHYFGLLHTFQCLNLPCESDHDVCTGAGSEQRLCPDVCPDTSNLMSASEDLSIFNVALSRCQLSEIARTMNAANGVRRLVVDHPLPAANESPLIGGCADDGNQLDVTGMGQSQAGAAVAVSAIDGNGQPRDEGDRDPLGTGDPTTDPRDGAGCEETVDQTRPQVARIDSQRDPRLGRVTGVIISFTEPIDVVQVQNGSDVQVLYGEQRVAGSIRWQADNKELVWTSAQALPAGSYSIWLAGQDGSDFRDKAGNVLVTNLEGFFTAAFELDAGGELTLPASPACGTGVLFPGLVSMLIAGARQRRRQTRVHQTRR